ncbi:phytoene desaturase family protein [Rhodococcus sp. 2H158]
MEERYDYDVIVIGAGPGGLTAAAYLAAAGRRVRVADARNQPGGHMSAFTHDGYEFDIGLHYTSEAPVRHALGPLGVDVTFREFDPAGMFRLLNGDRELAVPKGMDAFKATLYEAFPAERHTIDEFLTTVELLTEELGRIAERPHLRELPQLPWRLRGLLRYGRATAGGYLRHLHASPQLTTALLGWTTGSLAVAPSRLSLPVAARMIHTYLEGLSYPQGGSRVVSEGLAEVVRGHGGDVLLGTEVSRVLVDDGKVRGVRTQDASLDTVPGPGREIFAPAVVSAVDIQQTYLSLLPPDCVPPRLLRRVRSYELALPLAVVYLILDRDLAAEGYPNATRLVTDTDDFDAEYAALRAGELPPSTSAGLWIASLADPENPRLCAPGQTNVQLIGPAPAQHTWWGITPGSGSTARYDARRRELRDRLVRSAERTVPGLADAIVHEETGTPVTDERFMRCTGGVSYGPAFTPSQTFTRLGATGPVEGLFHAGAGVRPSHGLVGTLFGGVAAAAAVAGVSVDDLRDAAAAGCGAAAAGTPT